MPISYDDLARHLNNLENALGGNRTETPQHCPPIFVPEIRPTANLQHFALDTETKDKELPVVVAIGGNYTQGSPTVNPLPGTGQVGWMVEEDLNQARRNFQEFFDACAKGVAKQQTPGYAKEVWEGPCECPMPVNTNAKHLKQHPLLKNKFHLVMTNFSPWITQKEWSYYRDNLPAFTYWLIQDGLNRGHLARLYEELDALGETEILWLGHGCYDIYWFFRITVVPGTALGIGNASSWDRIKGKWAFTANSSQSPQKTGKKGLTVWP